MYVPNNHYNSLVSSTKQCYLPTVPSVPQNLRVQNVTSSGILLTWEEPGDPAGEIVKYIVVIQLATDNDPPEKEIETTEVQEKVGVRH